MYKGLTQPFTGHVKTAGPPCPSDQTRAELIRDGFPKGMTLVELIVVAAILSILGTISIFWVYHYQSLAYDVTAKHDLNLFIQAQADYISNNDGYLGNAGSVISGVSSIPSTIFLDGFNVSTGVTITVTSVSPFSAAARHIKGRKTYYTVVDDGTITE
ncbi:MAG: type II secretion system protein [Deltaproteobacteria bacterium]|nr:type II secretion system protein [Deltaproteobacteria bacterium]MBF0510188.1 type II secretion system protein [Deltaproteobacteria bacterium]MBF0527401.1 type II secretion system protein [Deltaproteobacteria bacterium]